MLCLDFAKKLGVLISMSLPTVEARGHNINVSFPFPTAPPPATGQIYLWMELPLVEQLRKNGISWARQGKFQGLSGLITKLLARISEPSPAARGGNHFRNTIFWHIRKTERFFFYGWGKITLGSWFCLYDISFGTFCSSSMKHHTKPMYKSKPFYCRSCIIFKGEIPEDDLLYFIRNPTEQY